MFADDSYRPLVTLLSRVVPRHRVSLLMRLAARLQAAGIDLQVLFGEQRRGCMAGVDAPWARCVASVGQVGSIDVVWQPAMREILGSDLVIIDESNHRLSSCWLHLQRRRAGFQLAVWGDGRTAHASRVQRLTRKWIGEVDWWFTSTELSRQHVVRGGFPATRITIVNDTLDGEALSDAVRRLSERPQANLARGFGCASANVAVAFIASHETNCIAFVLQAAVQIRERVRDFELLIASDAPEPPCLESPQRPWIKCVRAVTFEERARCLRAARLTLVPGAVGSVVVACFVAECPPLTTARSRHDPQIAYLQSGQNGLIVADDVIVYANAAAELLCDEVQLARLRRGCQESARKYSVQATVEHFVGGIESCLSRQLETEVLLS